MDIAAPGRRFRFRGGASIGGFMDGVGDMVNVFLEAQRGSHALMGTAGGFAGGGRYEDYGGGEWRQTSWIYVDVCYRYYFRTKGKWVVFLKLGAAFFDYEVETEIEANSRVLQYGAAGCGVRWRFTEGGLAPFFEVSLGILGGGGAGVREEHATWSNEEKLEDFYSVISIALGVTF